MELSISNSSAIRIPQVIPRFFNLTILSKYLKLFFQMVTKKDAQTSISDRGGAFPVQFIVIVHGISHFLLHT